MIALEEPISSDISASRRARSLHRLKSFIWLYLFLLIFEGAVRKWIPPLSAPFLLVRDPIAFIIWVGGVRLRIGNPRAWISFYIFAWIITTLGLLQIIGDSISPLIILYGWRSYVLHIPVIIVLAEILNEEDLRKIGKWALLLSIPMTLLMATQYLAPASSFLNKGTSDAGGQIAGALGHIRPAGTFSFITGPIGFIPLVAVATLWGVMQKGVVPRWLVLGAAVATIVAIPVSISRTIAIMVGAILIVALIGAVIRGGIALRPERLPQIALTIFLGLLVIVGISQVPFVQGATNTFLTRWTQAQGGTGDNTALEGRAVSIFTDAFSPLSDVSALGTGIGSGSTVAASLKGQDLATFEYGEGALQREMYELGFFGGLLFITVRMGLTVFFILSSFNALHRGYLLPWLLLVPAALCLAQGSLDQATSQGFVVVTIGISFAALRVSRIPSING